MPCLGPDETKSAIEVPSWPSLRKIYQNPVRLSAKYSGPNRAGLLLYLNNNCILVQIIYIAKRTSNANTVGNTCGSDCKNTKAVIWIPSCIGSLNFSNFLGTRMWFGVKDSYRSSVRIMRENSQSAGLLPAEYAGRLFRLAHMSRSFIVPIATAHHQLGYYIK